MSRSGYTDYAEENTFCIWRGAVESAMRGRRGQAFLREMLAALDALPNKRLISGELVCESECCALGAVALKRGTDVSGIEPDDREALSDTFGIAGAMAAEVMYENDEHFDRCTPEERFVAMRKWVAGNIRCNPEEVIE